MSITSRRFDFLWSGDTKLLIWLELTTKVPALQLDMEFLQSFQFFIKSQMHWAYRFDEIHPDGRRSRYGGGLVGAYELPFSGERVWGIEGAWFFDEDVEAHCFIWQTLLQEALDHGFSGLCVSARTTTHAPQMLDSSSYGVVRDAHVLMRGLGPGKWSAFLDTADRGSQFADCLRVVPKRSIDLNGVEYIADAPLYRGEGRVGEGPYSECKSLGDVARQVFRRGFSARGDGRFAGSLQEQIMHQGYVASATVSLTTSPEVALHYGTKAKERERALVFVLDPDRIREVGPIWDTFKSMTKCGAAWMQSDFEIMKKLVEGIGNLQISGQVLEAFSEGMKRFASVYRETLGLTSEDYPRFIEHSAWERALTVLTDEEVHQLCTISEFYLTWHEVPEGILSSSAYVIAFLNVREALIQALQGARGEKWRNPGWDTTVFGYFAKTCRDREFLSTGSIAGHCVEEARIVDRDGRQVELVCP